MLIEFFLKILFFFESWYLYETATAPGAISVKSLVMLWDQLWYAFVKKCHCQAFQLFLHVVFCLLVIPQTLARQKIYI